MRGDVLKTISTTKDVTNAIVLTHNIDFVFIQTVALAAFRRCGHPTLTIFADAGCAAESFAHQQPVLTGLGVRYRVVPVAMDPGFRFHPKAVLLSGEEAGTLLVGSGNLTFGGWRENAEVWLRFDSRQDGAAPFHAFQGYLNEILARVPLPDAVAAEVEEAFDTRGKSWLSAEPAGEARLVGRAGSGTALLDRMLDAVGTDPVNDLVICAPYFDDDGVGLRELVARTGPIRTTVLCQPGRSTLTRRSWEPSVEKAVLRRVDFIRTNASGEERSAFMHSKLYAFRRDHEVIVLAGSANCSRAALTASGQAGNAELLAVRTVKPAEFEEDFLSELRTDSEPVALLDEPAQDPDNGHSAGPTLRVLAARFESRTLLIAYSPPGASIVECVVDGSPARFEAAEKGVLRAISGVEPKVVVVRARMEGEVVESAPAWIDHEHYLHATARGRSLADSIRARLQPGEWNASGWAEVLDVFCKHLTYMPAHRAGGAVTRGMADGRPAAEVAFTAADVFSPGYHAPSLISIRIPAAANGSGHVQSVQQLLLRWFGIATEEPEGGVGTPNGTDEGGDDDNDETVDRVETIKVPQPSKPTPAADVSARDKRRIDALLTQIEHAMSGEEFLAERAPESLAADLKVASALLRLGLREGWIEHKRFFDLTHEIWSTLFFSCEPQRNVGWLEHRASTAEDRETFVSHMRSAELSAALIGWNLGAANNEATPEAARLKLAAALAVARLPWLWNGDEPKKIAEELAVLLAHTAAPGANRDDLLRQAEAEWALLLRRGQALRLLEAAVRPMAHAEIRNRIRSDELRPGDLLWQGAAGFCVVRQRASRTASVNVTVLRLQGERGETPFRASYTVPMRDLLTEEVLPHSDAFGDEPRQVLSEFIDELRRGFAV